MKVYIVMCYDVLLLDDTILEVFSDETKADAYVSSLRSTRDDDTIEYYVRDMEVR